MSNPESTRIPLLCSNCFNGNSISISKKSSIKIALGITIVVSITFLLTVGAGAVVMFAVM